MPPLDASAWGALSAIAVAIVGGLSVYATNRRKIKADAQQATIDGCIALINELQQERATDRKNHERQRAETQRSLSLCERRVGHLQSRMSMLVMHTRSVEAFLRTHALYDKAPQMDWTRFYEPPMALDARQA